MPSKTCFDATPRCVLVDEIVSTGFARAKARCKATGGGAVNEDLVDDCSGTLKGLSPNRSIKPSCREMAPTSLRLAFAFQYVYATKFSDSVAEAGALPCGTTTLCATDAATTSISVTVKDGGAT